MYIGQHSMISCILSNCRIRIPCAVTETKGHTAMYPVKESLHVLSNVVALNIANRCQSATHILTIHIVYFACHGCVYLTGQRRDPGNTARTLSTDRSALVHHFYLVCFSAAELFTLESPWSQTRGQRLGWVPVKPQ